VARIQKCRSPRRSGIGLESVTPTGNKFRSASSLQRGICQNTRGSREPITNVLVIAVMVTVMVAIMISIEMEQVEQIADRRAILRHVGIIVIHPGIGKIIPAPLC